MLQTGKLTVIALATVTACLQLGSARIAFGADKSNDWPVPAGKIFEMKCDNSDMGDRKKATVVTRVLRDANSGAVQAEIYKKKGNSLPSAPTEVFDVARTVSEAGASNRIITYRDASGALNLSLNLFKYPISLEKGEMIAQLKDGSKLAFTAGDNNSLLCYVVRSNIPGLQF